MKKLIYLLFVITILFAALSACGVKPVTVPCPINSGMTDDCVIKPGSEPMVANRNVPVSLIDYPYNEISAPKGTVLNATVAYGDVSVTGDGTNNVTLLRNSGTLATVNVTVKCPADCPVEVSFTGYGKP